MGSPNYYPGLRPVEIKAIVIHTMLSSIEQCDAWFMSQASQVSAHMGVALDGRVHQYVLDEHAAWSNGPQYTGSPWQALAGINPVINPNYYTLSIETEDMGDNTLPVTSAQYSVVLGLCRAWLVAHPSIKYLVAHKAISPTQCPGTRWLG